MYAENVLRMKRVLEDAKNATPKNEFGGIGLILYSNFAQLPVLPLHQNITANNNESLTQQIANASNLTNMCHDGFHLISKEWVLTHKNQYFAPPIPLDAKLAKRENLGARYMSALLGSFLPSVICIGIVSERDGIAIFESGKEVAHFQ